MKIHFVNAYFCQMGVKLRINSYVWMKSENIHAQRANVWAVIIYFYTPIHALLELALSSKGCNPILW